MFLHPSDEISLDRIRIARPVLQDHVMAREIGVEKNQFLHAGPPFKSISDITTPILNSVCSAAVFEGISRSFDEAENMVKSSEIVLQPAQDLNAVVPLAGVISHSMWLHRISDADNPSAPTYAPFNGGMGPAMRLGLCSQAVVKHLSWLNETFASELMMCHEEQLDLIAVAAHAIQFGDDCHGRTIEGTKQLIECWQPQIQRYTPAYEYLQQSPPFFLNLWMAACKSILMSANGIEDSSLVVSAGGNGFEVGLQTAGNSGQWHTIKAAPPVGDLGKFSPQRALGAIGDSAIVDAAGFGAMSISLAPEQMKVFEPYLPGATLSLPEKLLPVVHPGFGNLNIRIGLNARTAIQAGVTPVVSLGILDRKGVEGRIGGGIYQYPMEIFRKSIIDEIS